MFMPCTPILILEVSLYLRSCFLLTALVNLYKIITVTYLAHLTARKMGNIKCTLV